MMQAGKELARITIDVYNKMQLDLLVSIAVSGSILRFVPEIYDEFKKCCEKSVGEVTFVLQSEPAVKGTYYLMKNMYFKK